MCRCIPKNDGLKDHQPLGFIASCWHVQDYLWKAKNLTICRKSPKFSVLTKNSISFKYPGQVKQHLTSSSSQTFYELCFVTSIRFSKECELQKRVRTFTLEHQWTSQHFSAQGTPFSLRRPNEKMWSSASKRTPGQWGKQVRREIQLAFFKAVISTVNIRTISN